MPTRVFVLEQRLHDAHRDAQLQHAWAQAADKEITRLQRELTDIYERLAALERPGVVLPQERPNLRLVKDPA